MTDASDTTRSRIKRQTERIEQDQFDTSVGGGPQLTDIDGVGEKTADRLRGFGYDRPGRVARASTDDLEAIEGISEDSADDLQAAAASANRAKFEELEDIDGIGPTTAKKLNDAGIRHPYELRGKSQRELASIDGIGPKRAARIRADVEYEAPSRVASAYRRPTTESGTEVFRKTRDVSLSGVGAELKTEEEPRAIQPNATTIFARGGGRDEAISEHAERTPEARRADEAFNAPVMLDEDTWSRNKGEYDYPGVDTIPRSTKLERVREKTAIAAEKGFVGDIEANTDAAGNWKTQGSFSYGRIEVDTSFRQNEDTLAHELGHAVDEGLDRPSGTDARGNDAGPGIFDDPEVFAEAKEVSSARRGRELDSDYLESPNEVFADLFAEATINPRAAKRDAPKAFRALQDATILDTGKF